MLIVVYKTSGRLIELVVYGGSLVTLHTLVFICMTSVVKPVHIFMATSRASKTV